VTGGGNQYTTSYTWAKATTGRNTLRIDRRNPSPAVGLLDYTYRTRAAYTTGR
jgi:hypothetical protein